jgi:hypothetical protein
VNTDIIEGESRELEPIRALVVAQPGQALVSLPADGPDDMIQRASRLATALSAVVERQRLYATINGKKFPQVEAWMTIGRMDNVVAREAEPPVRHEDGSYEGFAELIRLSDGMVIGRASALCGTPDDKPWASRSEPARRSMAVTRATSRAFRQQYSWIMALAGYEATPAEEMPHEPGERAAAPARERSPDGGLIGTAQVGKGDADFELRQGPSGHVLVFRLVQGRRGIKVICHEPIASDLAAAKDRVLGQTVTVWGALKDETFTPKDKPDAKPITYQVLTASRVKGPTFDYALPDEPEGFDADDQKAIDAALAS